MGRFWTRLGRWIRRRTEATHDQALLQRLDKAEQKLAIAEDTISGLIRQLNDSTRLKVQAEANQRRALDRISELETELTAERMSIPAEVKRAEDKAIAAEVHIGALESELKAVQKVFEKQSRSIRFFRSGILDLTNQLKKRLDQFEEEWNARTKQEAERKDHHQRIDHDHPGEDQGRSGGDRDRGA